MSLYNPALISVKKILSRGCLFAITDVFIAVNRYFNYTFEGLSSSCQLLIDLLAITKLVFTKYRQFTMAELNVKFSEWTAWCYLFNDFHFLSPKYFVLCCLGSFMELSQSQVTYLSKAES